MGPFRAITVYRAASWLAPRVPSRVAEVAVILGGWVVPLVSPARALMLQRNLERVHGRPLSRAEARRAVARGMAAYGRYWAESFRLPGTPTAVVDDGLNITGYDHIAQALATGRGPIMVLPHLGGWEWAAFWLTRVAGLRITVVVENIEPAEVRDFFFDFRRRLGMDVVVLGRNAGRAVTAAIARGEMVVLLSDRDIEGNGVAVEFFGETTTIPAGPAVLALRTGARILPTAIYFDGRRHHAVVRPPLDVQREGGFRDDVSRVSQMVAHELEDLIAAAPEQWHLLQPNWPSDHEALRAAGLAGDA
jgi:lauroyl/myristoyl acyltransferase